MKKIILLTITCLFFASVSFGANTAIENLTADATPGTDSLIHTIDAPGSSPVSRKSTIAQILVDGNIPDNITIDSATVAGSLSADPANCVTATHFAVGINQSGVAECEAIADADVPDTITIDLATTAGSLTVNPANCGAGEYPLGIDQSGVAEDCTDASTEIATAIATKTNVAR